MTDVCSTRTKTKLGGVSGLACALLLVLGCSESDPGTTHKGGSGNVTGDGAGDAYSYDTDQGHFNADGVWEQFQEFCYPPPYPLKKSCEGDEGLWPKALQMALWFFNVNKSGPGVYCTDVQWRGDAHLSDGHIKLSASDPNGVDMSQDYIDQYKDVFDPDGDGEVDLAGGYYDAGDFIKFAITQGYMASTIAWAMYEFPEAFSKTGLEGEAFEQLRWAADFFLKATFIEDTSLPVDQWNVVGYAHQVGSPADHECGWMPPELRDPSFCPRPAYFATHENPSADLTSNNAAALALIGHLFKEEDPDYAERCINTAIALYNFAVQYPSSQTATTGGLYNSSSITDDLAWGAIWLYVATGKSSYLDEALDWASMVNGFNTGCLTSPYDQECYNEDWAHVWDRLYPGVWEKLGYFMEKEGMKHWERIKAVAKGHVNNWMTGPHSPQGFAINVPVTWGSGRYNSAAQLVALVYAKDYPDDPDTPTIIDWAKRQSRYLLGDNQVNGDPDGKSFMMGFTELSPNTPLQPHHAAGHASIYGLPEKPEENRHIIWGALVNGPDMNDEHVDQRSDYGSNEVTIDYNAAWVGALAGNTYFQSAMDGNWCPADRFPPVEPPIDEFYTMGKLNTNGDCRSQVEITMMNESIHPPRYNEFLTARYYIDVSEIVEAGKDPADMTATISYDNGAAEFGEPTRIKGPFKCENEEDPEAANMWYFVLSYEGYDFWGRQVKLKGPRTTQVDFGMPSNGGCTWDPANDWSYDSLPSDDPIKTPHITAYGEDGKLLWGQEPPCHPIQHVIVPIPID